MLDYPSKVIYQEEWTVEQLTEPAAQMAPSLWEICGMCGNHTRYSRSRSESLEDWHNTLESLTGVNEEMLENKSKVEDD